MVLSGPVKRDITGGHVEMHIWEYEVASRMSQTNHIHAHLEHACCPLTYLVILPTAVMHTNFNYFYCHKYPPVCDPCKPEALVYDNCNSPTHFTLTLNYIMPPAQTTGNYSVSLLSGHYYPKEVQKPNTCSSSSQVLLSHPLHSPYNPLLLLQVVVTVDYMYGQ